MHRPVSEVGANRYPGEFGLNVPAVIAIAAVVKYNTKQFRPLRAEAFVGHARPFLLGRSR